MTEFRRTVRLKGYTPPAGLSMKQKCPKCNGLKNSAHFVNGICRHCNLKANLIARMNRISTQE